MDFTCIDIKLYNNEIPINLKLHKENDTTNALKDGWEQIINLCIKMNLIL